MQAIRKIIGTGAVCVLALVAWSNLAPSQLGGGASYVITHGNSMAPRFDEGDLVLLHKGSYKVGDVIGYKSSDLQEVVLHRIVDETPEGFTTQGDNNSWLDSDRPKAADVLGKEWLHLPGAGRWLARARSPGVAAVLTGLVSLSFFLGNGQKKRRERKGKGPRVPRIALENIDRESRTALGAVIVATIVFLTLAFASFRQPTASAVTADAAYEHVGTFGYSAKVPPSPVYPRGRVEPGRPVFLKLVDRLRLTFDYHLNSEADHAVSGEALMFARVGGATGWTKVVPLANSRTFKGDRVRLEGILDFDRIRELSHNVQKITGLAESEQTIEVVPRIDVRGDLAGERVAGRFVPTLVFTMDSYQARVAAATPEEAAGAVQAGAAPFRHTEPGEVKISDIRSNVFNLLGLSVPIGKVRGFSLFGALLGLLVLGVLWRRISAAADRDEVAVIANKHREWLIPVEAMPTIGRELVRIKSIDALVRLAEVYERMILHEEALGNHSYFVEEGGVIYYYRPRGSEQPPTVGARVPLSAASPAADPEERPGPAADAAAGVDVLASEEVPTMSDSASAPKAEPQVASSRKAPAGANRPPAAASVAKKRPAAARRITGAQSVSTSKAGAAASKPRATSRKRGASDIGSALGAAVAAPKEARPAPVPTIAATPKKPARVPARGSREERRKRESSRLRKGFHEAEAEVL